MGTINITRISPNTPILSSYIKRMENWGKNGMHCSKIIAAQDKNADFYGVFYNENFLAASIIEHNELEAITNVTLANGSITHFDEIEEVSKVQLSSIAKDLYGEESTIIFSISGDKKLTKSL